MNLRSAMKLDGACIWITAATTHRTLLRNYSGWNAYRKFKSVFFFFQSKSRGRTDLHL